MSRSSSSVPRSEGGACAHAPQGTRCEGDLATARSVSAASDSGAGAAPGLPSVTGDVEQQLFRLLVAAAPIVKARIRRRRRGQPADDRTWCTSEAFSSVLRRVLLAGRAGTVRAFGDVPSDSSPGPAGGRLWGFIESVVGSVVGDFGRRARREGRSRGVAVEVARLRPGEHGSVARATTERDVLDALATLEPLDCSIMLLRLRGVAWTGVAQAHGMEAAACRKRWSRAVAHLRDRLAGA